MIFTQYYLDCLSQASYLIGDEASGLAAVVDPRRDIETYVDDAADAGLRIAYVLETHFHADFLSGHLELAEATGATIVMGEAADAEFDLHRAADGERFVLGDVVLEVRSTPGHTPESISVVVYEHADDEVPYGVLTGDTLFIGDVGRPDLLASKGVAADDLASMLYVSVHDKLLSLPDATRVFPGHGAGSACGKNLSTETQSTIGDERRTNYALAPMSVEQFVAAVTEGQNTPPGYFAFDAQRNRELRDLLDESVPPPALGWDDLADVLAGGGVVLDTRDATSYAAGHLRGSLQAGLDGRFAEYAGSVIDPSTPIVLLADPGAEADARNRLARIGFDAVVGYLDDWARLFLEHPDQVTPSSRVTAAQFDERRASGVDLQVIDVRGTGELAVGTIPGAVSVPMPELPARLGELDPSRPTVVHCAGGYRSMIGAAYLAAAGFADVSDLIGGYDAWAMHQAAAPA